MTPILEAPTLGQVTGALDGKNGWTAEQVRFSHIVAMKSTSHNGLSAMVTITGVNDQQLLADIWLTMSFPTKPASRQTLNDAICEMSESVKGKEITSGEWNSGIDLIEANCDGNSATDDDVEFGGDFLLGKLMEAQRIDYSHLDELAYELWDECVDAGEAIDQVGKSLVKTSKDG